MSDVLRNSPEVSRERIRRGGLHAFVKEAWPIVDPAEFLDEPHIKLICRHLEACALRATSSFEPTEQPWMVDLQEIKDLVIAVSPGSSKTSMSSVFFPAWVWSWCPSTKFICTSYSEKVVTRDAKKAFDLITSEWYQARWPHVEIRGGERASMQEYYTTAKGMRLSTPFSGQVTGYHGHILLADDPTKPGDLQGGGESAQDALEKVREKYDETFATRWTHPNTWTRIVIAQRLHTNDLSGVLIERGAQHLYLPMEFDKEGAYRSTWGSDWRTVEGELMAPRRFPHDAIEDRKLTLSSRAFAAQFNQAPSPADGSIFRREWFQQRYTGCPWGNAPITLSVDSSHKDGKDSDYTAIVAFAKVGPRYYVIDVVRARMGFTDQMLAIRTMRSKWANVKNVLIEAKSNGEAIIESLQRQISGVIPLHPQGGKEVRASASEWLFNSGCVLFPENAPWLEPLIEEFVLFPVGKHDDVVDALTSGLNWASSKDKHDLFRRAMQNQRKNEMSGIYGRRF